MKRRELADRIAEIIRSAVDDGSTDPATVRQFVVGPNRRRDLVLVFANDEWENYGYVSDDDDKAIGRIANGEWLAEIDALDAPEAVPPTVATPDERLRWIKVERDGLRHRSAQIMLAYHTALADLRDELQSALRLLATRDDLPVFEQLVGFCEFGIGNSGYADLVSFRHPLGAGELLPVHEHTESGVDSYAWATLTADGLTMLYPKGDEDSLSHLAGDSKSRTYRFGDIEQIQIDDDDGEVTVRMKGDVHNVRFTDGHTREEYGGPNREQIRAKLAAAFRPYVAAGFDPKAPPAPSDVDAIAAWRQQVLTIKPPLGEVAKAIFSHHGLTAATQFIAWLPGDADPRGEAREGLAEALLDAGQFAESVELLASLPPNRRKREWREELRCLLHLGRYADAHELAARCEAEETDPDDRYRFAPWRALALTGLGKTEEAAAVVRPHSADGKAPRRDHEEADFALACALQHRDPTAAAEALRRSLRRGDGWLRYGFEKFLRAPSVRAVLDERAAWIAKAAPHLAEIAAKATHVTAPVLQADPTALRIKATTRWGVTARAPYDKEQRKSDLCHWAIDGTTAWIATGDNGLWRADLGGAVPTINRAADADVPTWRVAVDNGLVVTLDRSGTVRLFDCADGPCREIAQITSDRDDDWSALAVDDGLLALLDKEVVTLFDITTPDLPRRIGVLGAGTDLRGTRARAESVALRGRTLYVTCGCQGLVVADVHDPAEPRIQAVLTLDNEENYADEMTLLGDLAVVKLVSDGHWLIDLCDPTTPRSLGVVPKDLELQAVVRDGDRVIGLDASVAAWTIDVADRSAPRVAEAARVYHDGMSSDALRPIAIALLAAGRLAMLQPTGVAVAERRPVDGRAVIADARSQIAALKSTLVDALVKIVADYAVSHPEYRAGAMILERWSDQITLSFDRPRSWPGMEYGPVESESPQAQVKLPGLFAENALPPEEGHSLDDDGQVAYRVATAEAWDQLLGDVVAKVATSVAGRSLSSGRVYLARRSANGMAIVDVLHDAAKPWTPFRGQAGRRQLTLDDLFASWDHIDKLRTRAQTEPEVRAMAYALAAQANGPAVRVVQHVQALDREAAVTSFLAAARAGSTDAIEELANYRDRAEVTAYLEECIALDPTKHLLILITAAKALDRCDDDRIVAAVRGILNKEDAYYSDHDLAIGALDAMKSRAPELRAELAAWCARAGLWENRLPGMARALFRAGEPEPPPALVEQSRREKSGEEYHSMKTGIKVLDDHEWSQHEACAAERLWIGKKFADRVIALRAKGDSTSPLWPPEISLEKHPASWNYSLASAWPHLETAGALDWFEATLASHAKQDEIYAADRQLLLCVLNHHLVSNGLERAMQLGDSMLAAEQAFDARQRRNLARRLQDARVVKGFQLIRAGDLAGARRYADAALSIDPTDGQTLFLDARLVWLEVSPEAGIERAKAHLEKLTGYNTSAAEGRLANLVGCIFDSIGKVDEAVPWFERAAIAHQEEPIYLANLAEAFDKLARPAEARRFAEQAKRMGSKSEIVAKILAAAGVAE